MYKDHMKGQRLRDRLIMPDDIKDVKLSKSGDFISYTLINSNFLRRKYYFAVASPGQRPIGWVYVGELDGQRLVMQKGEFV